MTDESDELTGAVIGAAIEVHRVLGPGLLESVYEECVAWEMAARGLRLSRQACVPIVYKGLRLDDALRIDLLVEDRVIVEVKAVPQIEPVHEAQLLSYLRLRKVRVGLLLNFWVPVLKNGIRRFVL